jgi:GT2 family glycosyltransferase
MTVQENLNTDTCTQQSPSKQAGMSAVGQYDRKHDVVVTVVIPNYNGCRFLPQCLGSVEAECSYLGEASEVIVVDNGSTDGSVAYIKQQHPNVSVITLGSNRGFAEACDLGVNSAKGAFCLLLNNDAWLDHHALERLLEFARTGPFAFVGPRLCNPDGSLQWGPQSIDFLGDPVTTPQGKPPFLVVGAAVLLRKNDYLSLGGFDIRYFAFYEETDLQWRAQLRGLRVGYAEKARVFHIGGGTLAGAIVRPGRAVSVERQRVYLARRNQLSSVLVNCSSRTLIWTLPLWLLSTAIECAGAAVLGQRALVKVYTEAIAWNVRHFTGTWERHRAVQATRTVSDGQLRPMFAPPFSRLRTLMTLARRGTPVAITRASKADG